MAYSFLELTARTILVERLHHQGTPPGDVALVRQLTIYQRIAKNFPEVTFLSCTLSDCLLKFMNKRSGVSSPLLSPPGTGRLTERRMQASAILKDALSSIRNEGVPQRFRDLVDGLGDPEDSSSAGEPRRRRLY